MGGKTVCPATSVNGDVCGAHVSILWKHMKNVHGQGGSGFYLPRVVREAHNKVGKHLKQFSASSENVERFECPECRVQVRRLDKHMKVVHSVSKANWKKMRVTATSVAKKEASSLTEEDQCLLAEFENEYMESRASGTSTSNLTKRQRQDHGNSYSKRYRNGAAKILAFLRVQTGSEGLSTYKLVCNFKLLESLSNSSTGFVDSLLR